MSNKILFVEDEKDLTLIVADTLREQGYDIITAADGIEGLVENPERTDPVRQVLIDPVKLF